VLVQVPHAASAAAAAPNPLVAAIAAIATAGQLASQQQRPQEHQQQQQTGATALSAAGQPASQQEYQPPPQPPPPQQQQTGATAVNAAAFTAAGQPSSAIQHQPGRALSRQWEYILTKAASSKTDGPGLQLVRTPPVGDVLQFNTHAAWALAACDLRATGTIIVQVPVSSSSILGWYLATLAGVPSPAEVDTFLVLAETGGALPDPEESLVEQDPEASLVQQAAHVGDSFGDWCSEHLWRLTRPTLVYAVPAGVTHMTQITHEHACLMVVPTISPCFEVKQLTAWTGTALGALYMGPTSTKSGWLQVAGIKEGVFCGQCTTLLLRAMSSTQGGGRLWGKMQGGGVHGERCKS